LFSQFFHHFFPVFPETKALVKFEGRFVVCENGQLGSFDVFVLEMLENCFHEFFTEAFPAVRFFDIDVADMAGLADFKKFWINGDVAAGKADELIVFFNDKENAVFFVEFFQEMFFLLFFEYFPVFFKEIFPADFHGQEKIKLFQLPEVLFFGFPDEHGPSNKSELFKINF